MPKSAEIPVGSKFSLWTVAAAPQKKGKDFAYPCRCECGRESTIAGTLLRAGRSRGCRSCTNKGKQRPDIRKPRGEAARNDVIYDYRRNARKRGIEFQLTVEQATALFTQNCHFCGSVPANVKPAKKFHGAFIYNGIDRIDNSKGYTVENTVPCCLNCNRAKADRTVKEFRAWAREVASR